MPFATFGVSRAVPSAGVAAGDLKPGIEGTARVERSSMSVEDRAWVEPPVPGSFECAHIATNLLVLSIATLVSFAMSLPNSLPNSLPISLPSYAVSAWSVSADRSTSQPQSSKTTSRSLRLALAIQRHRCSFVGRRSQLHCARRTTRRPARRSSPTTRAPRCTSAALPSSLRWKSCANPLWRHDRSR